jgi:hypothetical protein
VLAVRGGVESVGERECESASGCIHFINLIACDGREGKVTDCERNVDQGDAYWKAFQTKAGPLACPTPEVGKQHWVRAQTGCPAHPYRNEGDVVPFDGSVAEVASGGSSQ